MSLDMLVRQGMLRYPPRPDRPPSHRVAIFNSAGQIEDVISQSDVVRYLNDNISQVPEAGKTIAQLGLLSDGIGYPNYEPEPDKGAWTFPASTSAIDCLAEMHSTMRRELEISSRIVTPHVYSTRQKRLGHRRLRARCVCPVLGVPGNKTRLESTDVVWL